MIPWFHLEHHQSEPAWSGILWESLGAHPTGFPVQSRPIFLPCPPGCTSGLRGRRTEQYCHWVVAASLLAGDDGPKLSFPEARHCLRRINQEGRQRVIWILAQVGAGNDDGWQELAIPFIRKAWPNEQRYQTGETTEVWLSLLEDTEDSFPRVLAAVRDHLRPVYSGRLVLYAFHREAGAKEPLTDPVPARNTRPTGTCRGPDSSKDVPYGLSDVLRLLVEAEPALIGDRRYRRLHSLAAQ